MIHRRARGFTLIELLVVIAIIGVLAAISLPAIQAAREAARRSQCVNNLVQMMIALQHYESAHERLPSGVTDPQGPIRNEPVGMHHGWIIALLPYLDEGNIYAQVDFKQSVYSPANAPVRQLSLSVVTCPSAVGSLRGTSGYTACHHDIEAPIDDDNHGVMYLNSRVRIVDITDGSSHTIFVGEKKCDDDDLGWMSGTRATLRNAGTQLNLTGGGPPLPSSVNIMAADKAGQTATPAKPIDFPDAPIVAAGPIQPVTYIGGFSSWHSGGVANFGFGDGRVRTIADDISPRVLRQLANRADGGVAGGYDVHELY